jgi:MYXO-CTERM domain-containing protein
MKTSRISAALVVTLAMFAADAAFAADVPTATGGTGSGDTVVLNTYSKVWVSGDARGPQDKIGKNTGAGTMDAAFNWDDVSYKTDKANVNLITIYTRSANQANGNGSYMQGGFAVATLTATGVMPGPEVDLPDLQGERTWMRPEAGFLPGNRVLLMAASEDNGVNNNPQPVAYVADAKTGQLLSIPNTTRGDQKKPTNIIQTALKQGITVNDPTNQRGPHNITRVNDNTFVVGMQYNNQAQEAYSISVNPDNSIKVNWLQRFSNNARHCRPQVQIAPGATTGYIAAVEANNQPADIGFRVSEFNVATGKPVNSKVVVKSDPNNNKYVSEPVMGLLGDKLAITFGYSSKARNKGDNGDGHAGGRKVDAAVLVDKATLTAIDAPTIGVGQYGRHGSSFVTGYGPNAEPSLAVISGSSTGTGGGFIQMFPITADGKLGEKDAAKVYQVSPFSDVANVQARGKRNPNNQARGFINGLGNVPNPGFANGDATKAAANFMPEVKAFSFSTVTGYSGPDAMGKGLKDSIWLSLVPASWQEGIKTVPGGVTDTPGTNPDGTGPAPHTTTTPGSTGDNGDVGATDEADDATRSNRKRDDGAASSASDGCSVSHGSSTSSFGVFGLAIAGVLVAIRRRRSNKEA